MAAFIRRSRPDHVRFPTPPTKDARPDSPDSPKSPIPRFFRLLSKSRADPGSAAPSPDRIHPQSSPDPEPAVPSPDHIHPQPSADPRPAVLSPDHDRSQPPANPEPAVPSPGNVRFKSSSKDARPDPPDPKAVLSQWQRLGSLKLGSRGYNELLKTLVDVEGNRNVAMKFTDNDAGTVINIIGEVSFCDIVDCASITPYTCVLPLILGSGER
jgi:hypothetical protein